MRGVIMVGEINVGAVMQERQQRQWEWERQRQARRAWLERMARDGEWIALKEWWAACRAERRAVTRKQRVEAAKRKRRTRVLYGATLERAQAKWQRAQAEYRRRGGYRLGW